MDELISTVVEQADTEVTLLALQDISNRITKLGLTISSDGMRSRPLTKEEMVQKENDRRYVLKSEQFQQGVKLCLESDNSLELILSMAQFMNDLIKISKDAITKNFIEMHLSEVVVLLGHTKVSL